MASASWAKMAARHPLCRGSRHRISAPVNAFSAALGCDLAAAERLVHAHELDPHHPETASRIGPGCKVCQRPACPPRAFPLAASPGEARFALYSGAAAG